MQRAIHTFDNGVRVYEDHLDRKQRKRYRRRNVHEPEEEYVFTELINRLPVQGCFVNVGAAFGYYVILAHKLSPGLMIHGVEPMERHRAFLRENLRLNGLPDGDVVIHPEGISSSEGEVSFLNEGYGSCIPRDSNQIRVLRVRCRQLLERIGLRKRKHQGPRVLTIPTVTLDALVRRIGRPVDLLQMDVQGLEVEVLKSGVTSMASAAVKSFLIGTHSLEIHQECVTQLLSHGYIIDVDQPDTKEQPDGILFARHQSTEKYSR
ncbi:MAG: FkbM family methyltransferase [Chthoniobacterales bacterium]|nr:FkbM family methyltransferase [Chthoniobacterales bacterium]